MVAFLGTTIIFACFTASAFLARQREYLFLGSILSSLISIMIFMQFGSMIFGSSKVMFNIEVVPKLHAK